MFRSSVHAPEFDKKHLKMAGGYIGQNVMNIPINNIPIMNIPINNIPIMKTIV